MYIDSLTQDYTLITFSNMIFGLDHCAILKDL